MKVSQDDIRLAGEVVKRRNGIRATAARCKEDIQDNCDHVHQAACVAPNGMEVYSYCLRCKQSFPLDHDVYRALKRQAFRKRWNWLTQIFRSGR